MTSPRTARGAKVTQLKERLAKFGDRAEVVDIPDIANGLFPLDGVDAVIHTACPLPGSTTNAQEIVDVSDAASKLPILECLPFRLPSMGL
jgi:hypothetical protein